MTVLGDLLNSLLAFLGRQFPYTVGWLLLDITMTCTAVFVAAIAMLRARHWKRLYLASKVTCARQHVDRSSSPRLLRTGERIGLVVAPGADLDAAAHQLADLLRIPEGVIGVTTADVVPRLVLPADPLVPGQHLTLPGTPHDADTTHPGGHVTADGDTLASLASHYGIPWSVLARHNPGLISLAAQLQEAELHDHTARPDVKD